MKKQKRNLYYYNSQRLYDDGQLEICMLCYHNINNIDNIRQKYRR